MPAKEAFRFKDQAVTYADLAVRTNQLANVLIEQGVQPGDRVGIYMHKCLECAVAIYGIMKAGAAYVPLDPSAPLQRIAFMLEDCGIEHVVTHNLKQRQISQLCVQGTTLQCCIGLSDAANVPLLTIPWEQIREASSALPDVAIMDQDLAYIIYTSGSTGEPKGIMHTHYSGLSYARIAAELYGFTADDRLSNFPPLHFDQSILDYFAGPLVGATTVIVPEEHRLMPASLSHLIQDERLTVWYSVPYALIQLLLRGVLDERDMSSLRWVIYGGEPFPIKHLQALQKLMPNATFSNNYGPAETNQVSYYHIPSLDDAFENNFDGQIPIGQICPNMDGLVLDEGDQPVPNGEVGELMVRTPTMMQGYWNRPERNATAFYEITSTSGLVKRYYRAGDLVRLLPDGNYEFLGRKDRQIKTRGYRVELDEIEAALVSHDAVDEAAVFAVPNDEAGNLIKAAVLLKAGLAATTSELTTHIMQRVPSYALPTSIDVMEQFPRTTSGKIDRRQLREDAIRKNGSLHSAVSSRPMPTVKQTT